MTEMRPDLQIISDWIPTGSQLLDLGCGDGTLLAYLRDHKKVTGYGLEINSENITKCLTRGVNVIEQDLDHDDLSYFKEQKFRCGADDSSSSGSTPARFDAG